MEVAPEFCGHTSAMLESVLPHGHGEPVQFQSTDSELPVEVVCAMAGDAVKNNGAAATHARALNRWWSFIESVDLQSAGHYVPLVFFKVTGLRSPAGPAARTTAKQCELVPENVPRDIICRDDRIENGPRRRKLEMRYGLQWPPSTRMPASASARPKAASMRAASLRLTCCR